MSVNQNGAFRFLYFFSKAFCRVNHNAYQGFRPKYGYQNLQVDY